MKRSSSAQKIYLSIILILGFTAFIIPPFLGGQEVHVYRALKDFHSLDARIIFTIRLPRILFAFMVGAGLALVGAVFQALLRNDLATPYTLGVSSGGALGAVLAIKTGLEIHFLGFSSVVLFSIAGSMISLLIIYSVARGPYGMSEFTLILAGVTISLTASAFILFIHYLADFTETYRMVRWLMGGLSISGWQVPLLLLLAIIPVAGYFIFRIQAFNLLVMGRDLARSKGLDVKKLQTYSFFLSSILIGVIVSLAGPIGFVGLIVPHILRLIFGPDHRWLFPLSIIFGGAFLIWCDTLARLLIYPAEIPVGIITALSGGPFFIYLLLRYKQIARD